MSDQCLFCRIVRGDVPAVKVAETADCVAFRDVNPQAPVHILVVPKAHVASLDTADDPTLIGRMHLMAADLARREGVADSGYRTVINTNSDAGQTVFHIHLHLLGGRHMTWPPG
jgi:histidine triad (HIT) family protein